MKDSWDSAVRKLAEDHHLNECLSVYDLHFLKLDYHGHYRLWQIGTARLPTCQEDFIRRTAKC